MWQNKFQATILRSKNESSITSRHTNSVFPYYAPIVVILWVLLGCPTKGFLFSTEDAAI